MERLTLDGLPLENSDGPIVRTAIETELSRLLTEQGLGDVSSGAVPNLSLAPIELAEIKPAQLGHKIAQSIYTAFVPVSAKSRRITSQGEPTK